MQLTTILTGSLFATAAFGAIVSVDVGENGLVYTPDTITAAMGDQVQFTFYPQNHSVIQAAFSSPCNPLAGGIFSGFVPVSSGQSSQVFAVDITNTNPIWLYCGQVQHCESGMVAVINPPSGANTLDAFKANAKGAKGSTPSGGVSGGSFISPGSGSSSSTTSAGSSTTPSATSSATGTATSVSTTATATGNATSSVIGTGSASGTGTAPITPAIPTATGGAAAIAIEKAGAIMPALLLVGLMLW
ncbi:MAG: hypothetical protein M1839_002428 [Geoglossum umbratile]|nr:MAG: hypothetical protein M1839_002428 [Geoglossum umbratile]